MFLAWSLRRDAAFAFTSGSRAERSYREEKYDDALDIYERALKKRPGDPGLEYNRAVVLYRKSDFTSAEEAFMRSAILGKRDLETRSAYNAGNAKYRIGEEAEASNTKKAIEKYTEALDYYKRAMDLAPEDIDAKYNYEFVSKKIEDLESQQDQEDQQEEEPQDQEEQQEEDQQDQQDKEDQQEEDQQDQQEEEKQDQQDEGDEPKPDEQRDQEKPDSGEQEKDKDRSEPEGEGEKEEKDKEEDDSGSQPEPVKPEDAEKEPSTRPEPGSEDPGSMSKQQAELLLEQQEEEENRVRAQQKKERQDSRPPVLMDW